MSLRAVLAVVFVTLLSACGGGGSSAPAPAPSPTPIPYVPEEEPTPRNPAGRVTTQVTATCQLSTVDAVINASFRATVAGPDTQLRRVRLLLNNKTADDSGDIYVKDFEKTVTLHVSPGSNYSLVVSTIATNAIGPYLMNIVRCPAAPGVGA